MFSMIVVVQSGCLVAWVTAYCCIANKNSVWKWLQVNGHDLVRKLIECD